MLDSTMYEPENAHFTNSFLVYMQQAFICSCYLQTAGIKFTQRPKVISEKPRVGR